MAMQAVNRHFSPEFVNRLDEVLMFAPLDTSAIKDITKLQLSKLSRLLSTKGVDVHISEKCENWIASNGYDPKYGARPLKRLIQARVLNPMATLLIEGTIESGDTIFVNAPDELEIINSAANPTDGASSPGARAGAAGAGKLNGKQKPENASKKQCVLLQPEQEADGVVNLRFYIQKKTSS